LENIIEALLEKRRTFENKSFLNITINKIIYGY
jgi:hypothetical protein